MNVRFDEARRHQPADDIFVWCVGRDLFRYFGDFAGRNADVERRGPTTGDARITKDEVEHGLLRGFRAAE
jgi:hypothetical protein